MTVWVLLINLISGDTSFPDVFGVYTSHEECVAAGDAYIDGGKHAEDAGLIVEASCVKKVVVLKTGI
jgi:hypothetical protein